MKRLISMESVIEIADSISSLSKSETDKLVSTFQKTQEPLLVYIAAACQNLNEPGQDALIYLSLVAWEAVRKNFSGLKMVMIPTLDEVDEKNWALFDQWGNLPDEEHFGKASEWLEEHPQPGVMGFVLDALESEDSPYSALEEEDKVSVLITMKTVIDTLLQEAGE